MDGQFKKKFRLMQNFYKIIELKQQKFGLNLYINYTSHIVEQENEI
jgi:hypothetical protein